MQGQVKNKSFSSEIKLVYATLSLELVKLIVPLTYTNTPPHPPPFKKLTLTDNGSIQQSYTISAE